jgi:hypothetical protein
VWPFSDFPRVFRIFHRIAIVSDRSPAQLPHWHRKAGFLLLHRLLAELASQGYDAGGRFMFR